MVSKYYNLYSLTFLLAAAMGCGGGGGDECGFDTLSADYPWYGDNRAALDDFMAEYGRCPDSADNGPRPVAVFDFDNTIIKGDIGDGTIFHFLENDMVKRPPSWAATSKHLSAEALASLDTHCPLDTLPDPLPTSSNPDCLTAILCIYVESALWNGMQVEADASTLCTGAPAWNLTGEATPDTFEPAYAWSVSLQAGHTPQQINDAALTAFESLLEQPIGATRTLGHISDIDAYVRVNEQIRDLIAVLQANGFDVWISSASTRFAIEAVAPVHVGVAADRVIGVRQALDQNGVTTYDFEGCGTYPDDNQDIMNYRLGKRCFINEIIFDVPDGPDQLDQPSPIEFGAGDADTDIFFVRDASAMRLAINRNKPELMCHAYANMDGNWLINPLFFEPRDKKDTGYDCSAYGLPDQEDTVYCTDGIYDSQHCSAPLN